jgi:hypothetical protein
MKTLWHRFIARFFPGSVEEYYATRELRRREFPNYCRQPFYVIGSICYLAPMLVLFFSEIIPFAAKLLLLLSVWGMACVKDNMVEHYCLLILRGHGKAQSPNQALEPTAGRCTERLKEKL